MRVIITISATIPDDSCKEKVSWARAYARHWARVFRDYGHDVGMAVEFASEGIMPFITKYEQPSDVSPCVYPCFRGKDLSKVRKYIFWIFFALFAIALAVASLN